MTKVQGYRITGKFTVACPQCGGNTTVKYVRAHESRCKSCAEPPKQTASREEQYARYIDCGPAAWDNR